MLYPPPLTPLHRKSTLTRADDGPSLFPRLAHTVSTRVVCVRADDRYVRHQQREHALLAGIAAAEDPSGGGGPDDDGAASPRGGGGGANGGGNASALLVHERAKHVRLLRESSTFFKRAASSQLGLEARVCACVRESEPSLGRTHPGDEEVWVLLVWRARAARRIRHRLTRLRRGPAYMAREFGNPAV